MTTMNPLSDQFLAVESLIFSRSTIEFYRNGGTLPHELPPITFLWVQQLLLWACHPSWGLVVAGQQWEQPHLRLRSTCCASWLFFHHTITIPAVSFGSSVPMHLFLPLSLSFYLSKNLHPRKQQIVGWTSLAIFYPIFAENWKKKKKGRTEGWWWGSIGSKSLKFVWRQYCFGRKQCGVDACSWICPGFSYWKEYVACFLIPFSNVVCNFFFSCKFYLNSIF